MRELVRLGVDVHAAVPPGGVLSAEYLKAGVALHPAQFDLPVREPWRWPPLFREFRSLVKQIAPDILHSHFVGTTLTMRLALGKRDRLPRIFQVPGPLHLEHGFFRKAELATAGASDYWIGSCKFTCEVYRRAGVREDRLFLSYYGLDTARFDDSRRGKLRQELEIDEPTPLVGMVAYMYPPKWYLGQTRGIKGHEDFIDAIMLCLHQRPVLRAAIIGGAWNDASGYERRVRDYARRRCGDRVVFLGTRRDVPDLYADFDLVVHPSHSENVGGAGESLLFAVPTVATAVGGMPDLVREGETGWLVPPREPRKLAACILEILDDREKSRARTRRGQLLARELLDVRKTGGEILSVYQQILGAAA